MHVMRQLVVTTEEDMRVFARQLAGELRHGDIIALNGNLGAGKTFLVKAITACWGISAAASPTFAIVNQYQGSRKVYHFDFYRIVNERELNDIGFQDYIADPDAVIFIEWAALFPNVIPEGAVQIHIELKEDFSREVVYAAP